MASWWNDFQNSHLSGISLTPSGARNSSANGAAVDMKEAELGLFALLHTGTITDGTHDITLEESADGSTGWTAINDFKTGNPAAFAQLDSTDDDDVVRAFTFKRSKRFVRAVSTVAGATTGGEYSVSFSGLRKAVRKFGDPVS